LKELQEARRTTKIMVTNFLSEASMKKQPGRKKLSDDKDQRDAVNQLYSTPGEERQKEKKKK
jgi:hypothetical protein